MIITQRITLALGVIFVVFALSSCGSPSEDSEESQNGANTITIENFEFSDDITIEAGEDVVVTNNDAVTHTFTADDGSFDSGDIAPGETATVTIDEAGTYPFHCEPHPYMTGTITVS